MTNTLLYFRYTWPDEDSQRDRIVSSNYEVAQETDFVSRTVDLYCDGRAVRNSVKLAEREGPDFRAPEHRSLVHGRFLKHVNEAPLITITEEEFNGLWARAKDKPWPPKG